ncbi:hypothetical protein Q8A67_023864 [Cirrhinus molitorella]|uniref:Uncharacterized protein n=1 Tax=Cirrhinus molitorella TaxID=172907 RepID=A0AA88P5J7_9TELE|nr:hypothetical protein Q8A67_023864 [Cirrhinus molitorella]
MRATEGGVSGDRGEERGKQRVGLYTEEKEKAEWADKRSLEEKTQAVLQRMTGMNRECVNARYGRCSAALLIRLASCKSRFHSRSRKDDCGRD